MAAPNEEVTLIGLCDGEVDSKKYPSSYLTNKIGDLPDILPTISRQHPRCSLCNAALLHVVQVYCPLEASPYHRNLNIFACISNLCCGKSETWRVLRSQCLESEVKAAPVLQPPSHTSAKDAPMTTTDWCEGADEWGMEDEEGGGIVNDKTHTQSHEVASDLEIKSPTSTEFDVSSRLHDLTLRGAEALRQWEEEESKRDIPTLCPFYISVVDESDLGGENDLRHAQELLREYEKREGVAVRELESCEDGKDEKYEKTKARHGDEVFSRFMKKISICPEQILRYCWKGSPLFISEPPSNMAQMVPFCSHCGSPRTFELQLMPALVSVLQSKDSNSDMALEFGTVLVYTCRSSCWMSGSSSPVEEFIFIQADPDQKFFK